MSAVHAPQFVTTHHGFVSALCHSCGRPSALQWRECASWEHSVLTQPFRAKVRDPSLDTPYSWVAGHKLSLPHW